MHDTKLLYPKGTSPEWYFGLVLLLRNFRDFQKFSPRRCSNRQLEARLILGFCAEDHNPKACKACLKLIQEAWLHQPACTGWLFERFFSAHCPPWVIVLETIDYSAESSHKLTSRSIQSKSRRISLAVCRMDAFRGAKAFTEGFLRRRCKTLLIYSFTQERSWYLLNMYQEHVQQKRP